MKKKLAILIFLSLVSPFLVSAQITIPNPVKAQSLGEFIEKIATFIFNVALAIFPLMIVIAGFYMVTAAGDPAKVETGKKIILWTLIGFFIILLAKGLIEFLRQIF